MCTAMLTSWEGTARNLRERVALAVTARSPIERLGDFKKERGWQNLQIYSDTKGDYTRAYVSDDDGDVPASRSSLAATAQSATSGAGR